MWLINTETCALENITNPQMGSYAILSHTWEEEEVSFQQYHNIHEARKLKGLEKINMTIQLARNRGLQYAWVDTCCIDKSSSAELSEAINSMFKWYSDAAVCLVFLSDLSSNKVLLSTPDSNPRTAALARMGQLDGHQMSHNDLLARCRWFYRGWTLQELIAPTDVEFYDDGWNLIGNKWTLTVTITSITHIPFEVLSIPTLLRKVPIAQRMSWAANRSTTRVEDIAYCLFGLFGINLAPLYGEGENAFLRLQEELLRQSDDMSLFAWKAEAEHSQPYRGILAYSPREFRDSSFIGRFQRSVNDTREFRMTNKGLRLDQNYLAQENDNTAILYLQCYFLGDYNSDIGIHLMETPHGYVRFSPHVLVESRIPCNSVGFDKSSSAADTPIFLAKTVDSEDAHLLRQRSIGFTLHTGEIMHHIWPRAFHNSILQRAFYYTEPGMQLIMIECFGSSGERDKFILGIRYGLDGEWAALIDSLDKFSTCWGNAEGLMDLEELVKGDKVTEKEFDLLFWSSNKSHAKCHHYYEGTSHIMGMSTSNDETHFVIPGRFFDCAVQKRVHGAVRDLEIKVLKKAVLSSV